MGSLCIIPARGGSKRIPRKNIKDFLGKPIIAYSIETALKSELFDEVMVSTDDEEIAKIAVEYGAKVPFMRTKENSNDFATTLDVLYEVLNGYINKGLEFDQVCCFYPCAPFVSVELIQQAYRKMMKNNYDIIFPVLAYSHPIQRAFKISDTDTLVLFDEEHRNSRSQDLEKSYHDSGQFYLIQAQKILKKKDVLTGFIGFVEVSELECQDIDTMIDWKIAELKYSLK